MSSSRDYVDDISKYIIKEVPNFPMYYATECGRVISKNGNTLKFINGKIDKDGYRNLILYEKGVRYYYKNSRVIMLTFKGDRPSGMVIRHLDGNPLNDSIHNLEYSTQKENLLDREKHGTKIQGSSSPNAKLTEREVIDIIHLMSEYSLSELADRFNVHKSTIGGIKYYRNWKHIPRKQRSLDNGDT